MKCKVTPSPTHTKRNYWSQLEFGGWGWEGRGGMYASLDKLCGVHSRENISKLKETKTKNTKENTHLPDGLLPPESSVLRTLVLWTLSEGEEHRTPTPHSPSNLQIHVTTLL